MPRLVLDEQGNMLDLDAFEAPTMTEEDLNRPSPMELPPQEPVAVSGEYANPVPDIQKMDLQGFLKVIEQIESSGGKNFKHPTMKEGIHAGHTAMGRFGLMPNTIYEIANRAKAAGGLTPSMKKAAAIKDPVALKQYIERDPKIEREFAEQLALRLLEKHNNPDKAAYSWNQGHNLSPETIEKRDYGNADYVKKFKKLRTLLAGK